MPVLDCCVGNGLLLRADIHTLFDEDYLTVMPDYANGRICYAFQDRRLAVMPSEQREMPSRDYPEWHNDCVFMGRGVGR